MEGDTAIILIGFEIMVCFVVSLLYISKRQEQKDLNYRAELKAGSPSSVRSGPNGATSEGDILTQLVSFAVSPEGQKIISQLMNPQKAPEG
jgi:hypothetical protein